MKNIELICTINPATMTAKSIADFHNAGMTIARVNASHSDISEIHETVVAIRQTAKGIHIMLDLPGPEIRTTGYAQSLPIKAGSEILITTKATSAKSNLPQIQTDFTHFAAELLNGAKVLFMNGELQATVISAELESLLVRFDNNGILRSHAHIKIVGFDPQLPYLSSFDRSLIAYSISENIELLAISMVRNVSDINAVKELLSELANPPLVVVKFETSESLVHPKSIIACSDAIFVARGDLGNAINPVQIPMLQKELVRQCNAQSKPVFIATQMMSSMMSSPYPTRAEISDIANAVYEGCDGVTLSEETAIGKYPVEAIMIANEIIHYTQVAMASPPNVKDTIFERVIQSKELQPILERIADISSRIWNRGWAEANAGNLSWNVTTTLSPIIAQIEELQNYQSFCLVSKTCSRYRDIASDPSSNLVLVAFNDNAESYFPPERIPTSEWVSHRTIQKYLTTSDRKETVILHAHPTPIVILSQLAEYGKTMDLCAALPELNTYFPNGIGFTTYATPGSQELSIKSLEAFEEKTAIIWQQHGLLSVGKDIDEAFDYIEIVNKAAEIYLELKKLI